MYGRSRPQRAKAAINPPRLDQSSYAGDAPPSPEKVPPTPHLPRHRSVYLGFYLALLIPVVAFGIWWITRDEFGPGNLQMFLVSLAVIPIAFWGARVDAWTNDDGISIVNMFHRYRIPWTEIAGLAVVKRLPSQWVMGWFLVRAYYRVKVVTRRGDTIRVASWASIPEKQMEQLCALAEERGVEMAGWVVRQRLYGQAVDLFGSSVQLSIAAGKVPDELTVEELKDLVRAATAAVAAATAAGAPRDVEVLGAQGGFIGVGRLTGYTLLGEAIVEIPPALFEAAAYAENMGSRMPKVVFAKSGEVLLL